MLTNALYRIFILTDIDRKRSNFRSVTVLRDRRASKESAGRGYSAMGGDFRMRRLCGLRFFTATTIAVVLFPHRIRSRRHYAEKAWVKSHRCARAAPDSVYAGSAR
uniref:IlaA n=1 Tax=Streptomyces atratus TaxID=1893 RepID=A0A286MYQ7_STRAR|nr:IlaA [Streptomyces atratus]